MKGNFFSTSKGRFFFFNSVWFDPAANTCFKHSFSFSLSEDVTLLQFMYNL